MQNYNKNLDDFDQKISPINHDLKFEDLYLEKDNFLQEVESILRNDSVRFRKGTIEKF